MPSENHFHEHVSHPIAVRDLQQDLGGLKPYTAFCIAFGSTVALMQRRFAFTALCTCDVELVSSVLIARRGDRLCTRVYIRKNYMKICASFSWSKYILVGRVKRNSNKQEQ